MVPSFHRGSETMSVSMRHPATMPKAMRLVANGILGGAGLFCLALGGYCTARHGMAPHYAVLVVMGSLLLVSLLGRQDLKLNLSLFVLAIGVSLYAAEVVMLISARTAPSDQGPMWLRFASVFSAEEVSETAGRASKQGIQFDTRTRLEVIENLGQHGVRAYPAMVPSILLKPNAEGVEESQLKLRGKELLPLGGISRVTTVFCNENGQYTIYDSDETGFHNPMGSWSLPSVEIVAVGDSFTHGACVSSDKSFVGRIRTGSSSLVNLGMDDNGPLMMLASIKEYAAELKPKIVLWFYFEGNDLGDLRRERRSPLLMSYLQPGFRQQLRTQQSQIDDLLASYVTKVRTEQESHVTVEQVLKLHHLAAKIAALFRQAKKHGITTEEQRYFAENSAPASPGDMELFRKVVGEAQRKVQQWGGQLYFVYLPQWERYAGSPHLNPNRERVLAAVHDLRVPVIDVHPAFEAMEDPLSLFPFRQRGHYNEVGHELVASLVRQAIGAEPMQALNTVAGRLENTASLRRSVP